MFWRKNWREIYLTLSVSVSITIILAATYFFSDLTSLGIIAVGVFVSVLGVGMYDQQQAALAKAQVKTRR